MTVDDGLRRDIAATLLPGFAGPALPEWLAARLAAGLGGVCLFGTNVVSRIQLRALTDAVTAANPRAVIAIDEEGGDVTRLFYDEGSPYPGNAVLGRIDDPTLTRRVAASVGWELRRAGCNLTLAPVVDINSNSDNPVIGVRSFGSAATLVARHGAAWVEGVQSTGIAACAKHFPGHGDTAADSHLSLPIVDLSLEELRSRELVPFAAALDAGAKSMMTSHLHLPQLDAGNPATMSRGILQGLLRDELDFDGIIVSDALDMVGASGTRGIPAAAVDALAAGCDLLCIGTDNTDAQLGGIEAEVMTAVRDGRLERERVADAARRVRALASAMATDRSNIPIPAYVPEPQLPLERVRGAFDLRDGAAQWIAAAAGRFRVVRIDTVANIAVGTAPWGPFAELAADPTAPDSLAFAANPIVGYTGRGPEPELDQTLPVLVIGRDNHRHPFARALIDRLRARGDLLAVDMGWPSDDRSYADVATFGASRLIGRALMSYLIGRS